MNYVRSLLARDEQIVRTTRQHWVTLMPPVLVDAALIATIAGLSALTGVLFPPYPWFGLVLVLVPLVHLVLRVLHWRNAQTIVTSRRIIQVRGVLDKRVSDTLIEKVNDIVTRQSTWGRILGFGDLQIITGSDTGTDYLPRIADPIGFKRDLLDQQASLVGPPAPRPVRPGSSEDVRAEDIPELIEELAELRDRGLLTEQEFQAKKRELLQRI